MKKLILSIFIAIAFFGASAQTPEAWVKFSDLDQLRAYSGSLRFAIVTDFDSSGLFSRMRSTHAVDNIKYFAAKTAGERWIKLGDDRIFTAVEVIDYDGEGTIKTFDLSFNVYQLISVQVNSSNINIYLGAIAIGNQLTLSDILLANQHYKIVITYYYKL